MRFVGSGSLNERCPEKNNASGILKKEQKILEEMILEAFDKGDRNFGENEIIIKQSTKVDKLIVNEMLKTDTAKINGAIKK